jgi:carboxypeptidase Q
MSRSVSPSLPATRLWRGRGRLGAAVLLLLTATLLTQANDPIRPEDPLKAQALALDHKIINQVKEGPEIMTNLAYLSDQIGPRLTGSANLKRANEWTAERMRSYGLENVHLEPWTIPVAWERGTAYARFVEPDNGRTLTIASMGWSPGTKGKVAGDVVVIKAKNTQELTAYKGKLKNAVVLQGPPSNVRIDYFSDGGGRRGGRRQGQDTTAAKGPGAKAATGKATPPADGKAPATPGGPADGGMRRDVANFRQMMSFRRELQDFLRTEGAACILMDAAKPQGLLNMTGGWRGNDRVSAAEPIPSAFMVHEHYAMLYRLATRPEPAKTRVEIEIVNKMIPGPVTVYNTVGEIRGTEKPDEVVIVGAHLDSWDLGQGTTDNGTGTCCVLETARSLVKAGVKPKRTIRFCLFTGEEQGLYGSRAYVQAHKDELPKISLCLVHDTGTGKVIGLGLQGRESIKPILESELVALKELGLKDINLRGMGGSDHASFEQAGVPGFAVQQDMSEYNLTHHSQSDTLDKAHEPDLVEGVQVLAVAAVRVANLPSLLPRDKPPGSERGRGGFFFDDPPADKKGDKAGPKTAELKK